MKKIKILFVMLIFIGLVLYYNKSNTKEVDYVDIKPYETIKSIKINQNIPIPENIKQAIAKKEEQLKFEEEQKQLEQERLRLEQLEKERLEQKKQQKKVSKATSRGNIDRTTDNWIKFTATGYCPCSKCCGKTNGITSSGAKAQAGVTVAMPKGYSFGTKLLIKDTNGNLLNDGETYVVQDRGGAIKNNKIDIFFSSHSEALKFGKRTVYLKVVE